MPCSSDWRRDSPMSPKGSIDASHIWKRFRADRRRMLIRDELEHLRNAVRGQSSNRWRWALQDINLTARETFYLNGPLAARPPRRATRRFDAIVNFAELENAIDRQFKFYSSGM